MVVVVVCWEHLVDRLRGRESESLLECHFCSVCIGFRPVFLKLTGQFSSSWLIDEAILLPPFRKKNHDRNYFLQETYLMEQEPLQFMELEEKVEIDAHVCPSTVHGASRNAIIWRNVGPEFGFLNPTVRKHMHSTKWFFFPMKSQTMLYLLKLIGIELYWIHMISGGQTLWSVNRNRMKFLWKCWN